MSLPCDDDDHGNGNDHRYRIGAAEQSETVVKGSDDPPIPRLLVTGHQVYVPMSLNLSHNLLILSICLFYFI